LEITATTRFYCLIFAFNSFRPQDVSICASSVTLRPLRQAAKVEGVGVIRTEPDRFVKVGDGAIVERGNNVLW
jgi:hypothetical protein